MSAMAFARSGACASSSSPVSACVRASGALVEEVRGFELELLEVAAASLRAEFRAAEY